MHKSYIQQRPNHEQSNQSQRYSSPVMSGMETVCSSTTSSSSVARLADSPTSKEWALSSLIISSQSSSDGLPSRMHIALAATSWKIHGTNSWQMRGQLPSTCTVHVNYWHNNSYYFLWSTLFDSTCLPVVQGAWCTNGSNAMRLVKEVWKKLPQLGIEPQTSRFPGECANCYTTVSTLSTLWSGWCNMSGLEERGVISVYGLLKASCFVTRLHHTPDDTPSPPDDTEL